MERFFDVVQTRQGVAVSGASVSVYTEAGALATIYSDDGTTTTDNPLTTNSDGEYTFFAANGKYSIEVTASGFTTETVSERVLYDPADVTASGIPIVDGGGYYTSTNVETVLQEMAPWFTQSIIIACGDETTAITATAGKVTFRMPYAFTLSAVRASLTTAQTSGNIFTVDINEGVSSILSTKITIDNGEKTSTTANDLPVISDTALADDAEITIDVDQIGDGTAKGLKVVLIGRRT